MCAYIEACRCVQWSICIGLVARKQVHTHLLIIISLCVDLTLLSKKSIAVRKDASPPAPLRYNVDERLLVDPNTSNKQIHRLNIVLQGVRGTQQ